MTTKLVNLFKARYGFEPESVDYVGAHASNRQIYRIRGKNQSVIGIINSDIMENQAFVVFARHFRRHGLPVPEILADDPAQYAYLEEDLGDSTLLDLVTAARSRGEGFSESIEDLYTKAVNYLPRFQVIAGRDIDYSYCYPRPRYDRESMLWDMDYFREQFLNRSGCAFDSGALSQDFEIFADFLAEADSNFFMYRDFQARNIMVQNGELYFIDFQGGRRGPLQYDLASLLYQSTAYIPQEVRDRLLARYLDALALVHPLDRASFMKHYRGYVLIRLLQVLGAYGRKGLGEGKRYFTDSIPHALNAMRSFLEKMGMPIALPALSEVLRKIVDAPLGATPVPLTVSISSFSFKSGLPESNAGHGGGFVFDCRCLPNPGRDERFKKLTGRDQSVVEFLRVSEEVGRFFEGCAALVEQAVTNFQSRRFASLTVCFGCTGGQHRSVFLAEELARRLRAKYSIVVTVEHRDMPAFEGAE